MPSRKLTYATAMLIRESFPHLSSFKIIKLLELPVSLSVIDKIKQNKSYKTRTKYRENSLTYLNKKAIRNLFKLGFTKEWIAVKFNISCTTVYRVNKYEQ